MKAILCDECKKVIEGLICREFLFENESGKGRVDLDPEKDWCSECGQKNAAKIFFGGWDSTKAGRKAAG